MTDKEKAKLNRLAGFLEGLIHAIDDSGIGDAVQMVIESIDEMIDEVDT